MPDRIIVIGCPGAGKSTFARRLREKTGLPLIYLDRLWHRPDRTTVSREEFDRRLERILAGRRWIIDGNYARTLERRLCACEAVFFLDLPTEECLAAAAARVGQPREDMPWVETEFDGEFRRQILDFPQRERPKILQLLAGCRDQKRVTVFRSRDEIAGYLAGLSG